MRDHDHCAVHGFPPFGRGWGHPHMGFDMSAYGPFKHGHKCHKHGHGHPGKRHGKGHGPHGPGWHMYFGPHGKHHGHHGHHGHHKHHGHHHKPGHYGECGYASEHPEPQEQGPNMEGPGPCKFHGKFGHGKHGHGKHDHGKHGHGCKKFQKPYSKCFKPYKQHGKCCKRLNPCEKSGTQTCERGTMPGGPEDRPAVVIERLVVEKGPRCYSV